MTASARIIVAIDGHSSTGKSTLAKALARELSYAYIDTGAMYRCVTLYALQHGMLSNNQLNAEALVAQLSQIHISFGRDAQGQQYTMLNGQNVEAEIRGMEVSAMVSPVATVKEVRQHLVALQQVFGREKGLVMDGRDIGTVVFPEAELKVFMTTSPEIRAQRRYDELRSKGDTHTTFDEVLDNVRQRDHIDENRAESPLRRADDALLLDNGQLTRNEQLQWVLRHAQQRIAALQNS